MSRGRRCTGPGLAKAKPWQDHCRLLYIFYHALPKGRRIEDAIRRDIAAPSFGVGVVLIWLRTLN
eukprot:12151223-Heterocapsa_arctica.AAC.1